MNFFGCFALAILAILLKGNGVLAKLKCGTGNANYEIWRGNCYSFSPRSNKDFAHAKKKCEEIGYTLASIHSEEENDFIVSRGKAIGFALIWIGMIKDNTDKPILKDNYYWLDGSEKVYENWAPGQPNGELKGQDCVDLSIGYFNVKRWRDKLCTNFCDGYICKTKAVYSWDKYGSNDYYISDQSADTQLNWYNARKWCMDHGGDLVSFTSQGEVNHVAQWAADIGFNVELWIGANKLHNDRIKWSWSDYTTAWSYTNWKTNYPDEGNYGHYCGYQKADDIEGKWQNGHCDNADKGYICKRPAGVPPTPKTDPVTPKVTGYCPAGYIGSGNKCFMVKALPHDQGLSFSDAVNVCKQQDGYLPDMASITNELDQAWITSQLQSISYGLWIGLYKHEGEDEWQWVDNSPWLYENWAPKEPSGNDDHCAEVWVVPGPVGSWNNINCKEKRGYVCQTYKDPRHPEATRPSTTPHNCPRGFSPYWYGCYRYDPEPMPWSAAQAKCKEVDANCNLVGIHHDAENAAVQTIPIDRKTEIWTGFVDEDKSGEYKWKDGWVTFYTNWANGQPRRENNQSGCVKMSLDGTWSDSICSVELPSLCKISRIGAITTPATKEGQCPEKSGWEEYDEHCYYFEPHGYADWDTAKTECQKLGYGATLASIHSDIENRYIYDLLDKNGGGRVSVWLGMYRSKQDKSFRWTDGSSVQYEGWAPGEPNGEERDENCVEMYNQYWPTRWNDHYCHDYKGYVCKAEKRPPLTLPTQSPHCPVGWIYFKEACYYFSPDLNMMYNSARQLCAHLGGGSADLASIHSWTENLFIKERMYWVSDISAHTNFYIGMSKTESGEPYVWEDGSEVDYEHWAPSEPSDKDGDDENCVEMDIKSGRWNDINCNEVRGMVCKMTPSNVQAALSGGAVAGIVLGSILGVFTIAVVVAVVFARRRVKDNPLGKFRISGITA